METYVFFTPEELDLSKKFLPKPDAVVVLDILRATTTITQALELGARCVEVFPNIDEVRRRVDSLTVKYDRSSILCLGERNGKMIDGFDAGNSPVKLSNMDVRDKIILMTTTNGTRAISTVSYVDRVFCGCLRNRKAISEHLLGTCKDKTVFLLCSGWKGGFSLEDTFGAGAILYELLDKKDDIKLLNDQAVCSLEIYKNYIDRSTYLLKNSCHGKRLLRIGCKEDIEFCSSLDSSFCIAVKKGSHRFEALR